MNQCVFVCLFDLICDWNHLICDWIQRPQMTKTVPGVGGQSCCPDLWEALVIGGQKETVLTLQVDFLNFVYAWIRGLVDV